ncbi:ANK_REP_REGION domain-containing protein [Psidium guajava]|nr:ANK_REP_REGION domain-containing protein [Psidium guajava]
MFDLSWVNPYPELAIRGELASLDGKRKRTLPNRESTRWSRMRKQKYLDKMD